MKNKSGMVSTVPLVVFTILNFKIVLYMFQAMYEYLPGGNDVQPMTAWLAVMEKAHVNLSMYVNCKVHSNVFEELRTKQSMIN